MSAWAAVYLVAHYYPPQPLAMPLAVPLAMPLAASGFLSTGKVFCNQLHVAYERRKYDSKALGPCFMGLFEPIKQGANRFRQFCI